MTTSEDHGGREYQPGDETQASQAAGEQAQRIAASGEAVRDRVRQLVVETVQQRHLELDQLSTVAQQVLEGAAQGVKDTAQRDQQSVLKAVVDGVADSYSGAANATRQALDDAAERGKHFADDDLKRALRNLRALDERFIRTVTEATGAGYHALSDQAQSLIDHAKQAAESMRPSIESALKAAKDHPTQLGGEAAAAGVEATRQTAGRLLNAVAGLLQGAGDALSQPRPRDEQQPEPEGDAPHSTG